MLNIYRAVVFKQNFNVGRISQNQLEDVKLPGNVHVQCFPIYSILSALNRTTVDYFSLDVEGDELSVLKTIPWKSVHIQVFLKKEISKNWKLIKIIFTDVIRRSRLGKRRKRTSTPIYGISRI